MCRLKSETNKCSGNSKTLTYSAYLPSSSASVLECWLPRDPSPACERNLWPYSTPSCFWVSPLMCPGHPAPLLASTAQLRIKSMDHGIYLPWTQLGQHSCMLLFTEDLTESTNWFAMMLTQTAFTPAIVYWRPYRELNPQMELICLEVNTDSTVTCHCLLKNQLKTESTNGIDLPWSLHSHHSCTLLFTEDPTENWIHKWNWSAMKFTQPSFMYAIVYCRPHWELNPQMELICHEVNTESIDMCHFLLKTQPRTVSTNGYESAMKLTLKALTCAISYWRPNRELYPQMEWLCCKLTLTAVTHATLDWRPSQRWRELNPHTESICSEADTDRISHKNPLSDAGNHNYSTFHQTED